MVALNYAAPAAAIVNMTALSNKKGTPEDEENYAKKGEADK